MEHKENERVVSLSMPCFHWCPYVHRPPIENRYPADHAARCHACRLYRRRGGACHSEIFAPSGDGSGAAAALALALDDWRNTPRPEGCEAEDRRAVLWVQMREAARLVGRPYRPGLPEDVRHRVIHVLADTPEDALFALEEGVRCRDIAFVIGEMLGNPRALDFTASRRLTLAAERHGVPLYLVRLDARRDLSSARMRWNVASAPSPEPRWNPQAPGTPAWHAELFRARGHRPGEWVLGDGGRRLAARSFEAPSKEHAPFEQASCKAPAFPA
jgi:protein ImuA